MAKGKVVEASFSSSGGGNAGAGPRLTGKMIEDAQSAAVLKAMGKGIIDPAELLKLKEEARAKLKEEHRKAVAKFLKEQNAPAKAAQK